MLEPDDVPRQLLEARDAERRVRTEHDFHGAGEERLSGARICVGGRDELLDERCRWTVAETDDRPAEAGPIWRAERPADHDRLREDHPCRDVDKHAVGPERPRQLGELVVAGDRVGRGERVLHRIEVIAQRSDAQRRISRRLGHADDDRARIVDLDQGIGIGVVRQVADAATPRERLRDRGCAIELRVPQVDVGGVEQVGLAR